MIPGRLYFFVRFYVAPTLYRSYGNFPALLVKEDLTGAPPFNISAMSRNPSDLEQHSFRKLDEDVIIIMLLSTLEFYLPFNYSFTF